VRAGRSLGRGPQASAQTAAGRSMAGIIAWVTWWCPAAGEAVAVMEQRKWAAPAGQDKFARTHPKCHRNKKIAHTQNVTETKISINVHVCWLSRAVGRVCREQRRCQQCSGCRTPRCGSAQTSLALHFANVPLPPGFALEGSAGWKTAAAHKEGPAGAVGCVLIGGADKAASMAARNGIS
jgi:hypothetical protein